MGEYSDASGAYDLDQPDRECLRYVDQSGELYLEIFGAEIYVGPLLSVPDARIDLALSRLVQHFLGVRPYGYIVFTTSDQSDDENQKITASLARLKGFLEQEKNWRILNRTVCVSRNERNEDMFQVATGPCKSGRVTYRHWVVYNPKHPDAVAKGL